MKIRKFPVGDMLTNCYFLMPDDGDELAVVDPGDNDVLLLQKLAATGRRCTKILLTHGHFDHIMALPSLRKETGAPVYIHRSDAAMLTDPTLSCMSEFSSRTVSIDPAEHLLEDGDVLQIGGEDIAVCHTPGHTPGSVCYRTGEYLLCGDTLFRGGIGRYDLPGGDYDVLMQSLQKITGIEDDLKVYPGHGPSTSLMREKTENLYLI